MPNTLPSYWQHDARDMIRAGGEEWIAAAQHVGMADSEEEAWELYEASGYDGTIESTLIDMIASYWRRNGGYVITRNINNTRIIMFADDPRLDAI